MVFKNFSATNLLMQTLVPELIAFIDSNSSIQCRITALSKVLLSNFIIHQGCYLLESGLPKGFISIPEQEFIPNSNGPDRTSYEVMVNHVHTSDFWKKRQKGLHHLLTGIIIADNWKYKLKSVFPSVKFKIVISFSVLPISGDDEYLNEDCMVSFHSIRDGELYYDDNLNNYKLEAVGIIEV